MDAETREALDRIEGKLDKVIDRVYELEMFKAGAKAVVAIVVIAVPIILPFALH